MPFSFRKSARIPDVMLIDPKVFPDGRGWFMETYKTSEFAREGIFLPFLQWSQSYSEPKGVLRGMHYQNPPADQGKLVRCIVGEIFDVAVDIRRGSPTYGKWTGENLSSENRRMMWIPPGFAHGFCVLSDTAEVLYGMTAEYDPAMEGSVAWNDPSIGIAWPNARPVLSSKDSAAPPLEKSVHQFSWKGNAHAK